MRVKAKGVSAYLRLGANTAGCTVEDISAGGMFLRTDRVVAVGTTLSFDLVDPEQQKAVTVSATVVGIILKEAAEKRGVPQGLRLKFNRQPGATQAYLQKLLGRLGAPMSDAPVFYAVTQQPPRAKVDLPPAGGSLPKLRRQAPAEVRMAPPKLEAVAAKESAPQRRPTPARAAASLVPAGSGPPESTRAAPAEDEAFFDEAPAGTDTALEPKGAPPALGAPALEEVGTLPALQRPASIDPDATEFALSPPASVLAELQKAVASATRVPEAERAKEGSGSKKSPTGEKRAPVAQLDAAGVIHDVTAYRAALAEREAAGEQEQGDDEDEVSSATDVSELITLRQKLALLEEALHARDERISDLEAEVLSLRYQLQGDALDATGDWEASPQLSEDDGEQTVGEDTAEPTDEPTPVRAPSPRRPR